VRRGLAVARQEDGEGRAGIGALSTCRVPPCARDLAHGRQAEAMPNSWSVNSGSKMRGSTCAGMPGPVSLTATGHAPALSVRTVMRRSWSSGASRPDLERLAGILEPG